MAYCISMITTKKIIAGTKAARNKAVADFNAKLEAKLAARRIVVELRLAGLTRGE